MQGERRDAALRSTTMTDHERDLVTLILVLAVTILIMGVTR